MKSDRRKFLGNLAVAGAAAASLAPGLVNGAEPNPQPNDSNEQTQTGNRMEYKRLKLEKKDQVATITLISVSAETAKPSGYKPGNLHWELGEAFNELRLDNDIRVIVMTGSGGKFQVAPQTKTYYGGDEARKQHNDPKELWLSFTGVVRTHFTMAEIEKPIIAKVNGHAIGFGSSLVFASDLIVARDDAKIVDMHLGMGEVTEGGPEYGIVPGDGGVLACLYMTPARAKEYLMLARSYTGKELADMGIINYAVPASQLDAKVDELVERLLKRPSYSLAWTKRIANRQVVSHLNKTLDAAAAYEMAGFLGLERMGWKDPKTFQ